MAVIRLRVFKAVGFAGGLLAGVVTVPAGPRLRRHRGR
jgi:hypothetical protein